LPRLEFDIVPGLDSLLEAWGELAAGCHAPPFSQPGWYQAFAEAFGWPTHALVARRAGSLVGVVPLSRHRTSMRSPTNWHTPRFAPLAEDDAVTALLAASLVRRAPACLDLSAVDQADVFALALLEEARACHRAVIARVTQRSPYVTFGGDFAAYEARRSTSTRAKFRQWWRRLERCGVVELAFEDGTRNLDALLTEGFAVEGSGWKTGRGTAIVQDPRAERLYRTVARWAAAHGSLELAFLRLDGTAVAFAFSLTDDDTTWCLKTGYDPAFRRLAVGILLMRETLRHACDRGAKVFDFLGDDDPYKLAWTDHVRELQRIQIFDRSPVGIAGYTVWRHGRPLARRLTRAGRDHGDGQRDRRDAGHLVP
jgi:CelD/BcsL family acetyltransferase involved in cellulose biosynthesis